MVDHVSSPFVCIMMVLKYTISVISGESLIKQSFRGRFGDLGGLVTVILEFGSIDFLKAQQKPKGTSGNCLMEVSDGFVQKNEFSMSAKKP